MTYAWGALTVADAPRWAAFTKIVSDADDTDEVYTAEDLAEELEDPASDPRLDTIAVEDEQGTLAAVGQVLAPMLRPDGTVRVDFAGYVHPDHRGRGIGTELLRRQQARAGDVARERHPGLPAAIRTTVGVQVGDARALLEANGYGAARYFHTLVHSLEDVTPAEDARVQPYDVARDAEVHATHSEAFSAHWGSFRPTDEQWRTWFTGSRTFRPTKSLLSIDGEGAIQGYLLSYQYQPGELLIGQLGVLPAARGQGVARAMLRRALAVAGPDFGVAKLDVDSENADGAGWLYESVGFTRQRTTVVYQKS